MLGGLAPSGEGPLSLWVNKLVQSVIHAHTLNNNTKEMKPC